MAASFKQVENCSNYFILFAEDEPDQAEILRIACKQAGIPESHFHITHDGLEALLYLEMGEENPGKAPPPTLMVLDLFMPVMNGLEILEKVRSNPRYQQLPVYIFTSSPNPEHKLRATELGCSGFLQKYDHLAGLVQLLKSLPGKVAPTASI